MIRESTVLTGDVIVPGKGAVARALVDPTPADGNHFLLVKRLATTDFARIVRSSGVIVETGCSCDHASQICRTIGVPVVRLPAALSRIRTGRRIYMDGATEDIYLDPPFPDVQDWIPELRESSWDRLQNVEFQIGIFGEECVRVVNKATPTKKAQFFYRAEFLWLRRHECPFHSVRARGVEGTAAIIRESLQPVVGRLRHGQTLNLRSLDARSDEFHFILDQQRGTEGNPQLGLHGIRHLLKHPGLLKAELLAVDALRSDGFQNVVFSLPFLTDPEELDQVRQIASTVCADPPPIGVYVETPAAVYKIGALLQRKLPFVCVGTKDLAQLILGVDRTNRNVQHLYSLTDRAVLRAVSDVVSKCASARIPAYVYADLRSIDSYVSGVPQLDRLSVTRGDYQAIATGLHHRCAPRAA